MPAKTQWRYVYDRETGEHRIVSDGGSPLTIAFIGTQNCSDGILSEYGKLIAAAPQLLAIAKEMRGKIGKNGMTNWLEKIDSTIASASK